MNYFFSILIIFSVCFSFTQNSFAEASEAKNSKPRRPQIGLVLGGGGALGFAHVGVLKVMHEENVPVDIITGTSMGAIVAGAYASGRSVPEMEKMLADTDWDKLFSEESPRRQVPYRYKAGRNREIYGDVKLALGESGILLPAGVIQGQNVVPLLQRLFDHVPTPIHFDKLPIPFRSVATDIETGEPVVIDEGDLATVVRASMSIPAIFSPVLIDDHLLVDGGLVDNVPVTQALKLGADILIVVRLKYDMMKREEIQASPLAVSGQSINLLLMQNSLQSLKLLREQDLLIEPDLGKLGAGDFAKGLELMKIGEETARKLIPQLRKFAVPEEEFKQYTAKRTHYEDPKHVISFIRVDSDSKAVPFRVKKYLSFKEGDVFNRETVENDVRGVFETGEFREVRYDFVEEEGKYGVVIRAKRKEWFDRYVRVGASFEDDFSGDARYQLGLNYRVAGINEAGAYADFDLEVGKAPRLFAELYQPLGEESPYFIAPSAQLKRSLLYVRQDRDIIAEYERDSADVFLRLGRELGRSGEMSVGYQRGTGTFDRRIGDSELNDLDYDIGDVISALAIDDLDTPDFPTEGLLFSLGSRSALKDLGSNSDFDDISTRFSLPLTYHRTTLLLGSDFANTFNNRPIERSFSLGGFLNISGYEQSSLLASDYFVGRAALYHRFSELKTPIFGFGFFAGGSLEFANLRSDIDRIPDNRDIVAGSVFVGADTPLLPLYLSFGTNDNQESAIYLVLGRIATNSNQ